MLSPIAGAIKSTNSAGRGFAWSVLCIAKNGGRRPSIQIKAHPRRPEHDRTAHPGSSKYPIFPEDEKKIFVVPIQTKIGAKNRHKSFLYIGLH
jgi:hypothetical protein